MPLMKVIKALTQNHSLIATSHYYTVCPSCVICFFAWQVIFAQDLDFPDSTNSLVSGKYLSSLNKTAGKLETSLDKKTDKLLRKLQQQENRIYKKLQKTDSVKAKQFLEQNQAQYKKLEQGFQKLSKKGNTYTPSLDTQYPL